MQTQVWHSQGNPSSGITMMTMVLLCLMGGSYQAIDHIGPVTHQKSAQFQVSPAWHYIPLYLWIRGYMKVHSTCNLVNVQMMHRIYVY